MFLVTRNSLIYCTFTTYKYICKDEEHVWNCQVWVRNFGKRMILLEHLYLVRIHRTFGKFKVSIFTIERRMQEYWKDERGLRSTYAFYQLFSIVNSAEVLKLVKWRNCSINQGQTFFIGNKTYLTCLGRFCIFLTALWILGKEE